MSDRMMREGLTHEYAGLSDDAFFSMIDSTGGWPIGFAYVGFTHSSKREAGFCNSPSNDGWWTVLASADDYYLWKLSPKMLQRVVDAAIASARVTSVQANSLRIKNHMGYFAKLAKEPSP